MARSTARSRSSATRGWARCSRCAYDTCPSRHPPPLPLTQTARPSSRRAQPPIAPSSHGLVLPPLPWLLPVFPTSLLSPFLRPTLLAPPFSRLHACTVHPPPRHPLPASLPPTLPPPPCPSHTPVRTLHAWSALHSTHDQHALSAGIRRQRSPHPGRRPRPRWLRRDQAYHWLKACAPGGRGSFSRARKGVHGRARFSCALAIGDAINCEKTRQQAHTT